jgi:hypothetical protein
MGINYTNARLGEDCPHCGSTVRVRSAKKFLSGHPTASICVECDCNIGFYHLNKKERAMLPAMLGLGRALT